MLEELCACAGSEQFPIKKTDVELCACTTQGQFPIKKTDDGVVRMRQLRTVSWKQMMELCACASSGQFPIKKTDVGFVRMRQLRSFLERKICWSCTHAPAQDIFLERKQMLELCACASSGKFPIKKKDEGVMPMRPLRIVSYKENRCWSCQHAPAQESFLERKVS
jgi:hypothetical protein